jgi:DNA-binding HxlR family transcriptional regulator
MAELAVETESCGLGAALRIITGKWKPSIIWLLHDRPRRFAELRRKLDGISEKVLAEQLRELERDGVVHRRDFEEVPPHVEYSLTASGGELNAAVHTLALWGDRHAGERLEALGRCVR